MRLMFVLALLCAFPALAALTHESELSLVNAGGNSELQAYNSITKNKYQFEKN